LPVSPVLVEVVDAVEVVEVVDVVDALEVVSAAALDEDDPLVEELALVVPELELDAVEVEEPPPWFLKKSSAAWPMGQAVSSNAADAHSSDRGRPCAITWTFFKTYAEASSPTSRAQRRGPP